LGSSPFGASFGSKPFGGGDTKKRSLDASAEAFEPDAKKAHNEGEDDANDDEDDEAAKSSSTTSDGAAKEA
jgi:hypothetical protein